MTIPEYGKLDFMKLYEGVGEEDIFLHSIRFCLWNLQIKRTKTGETVYYVCIRGPRRKIVKIQRGV